MEVEWNGQTEKCCPDVSSNSNSPSVEQNCCEIDNHEFAGYDEFTFQTNDLTPSILVTWLDLPVDLRSNWIITRSEFNWELANAPPPNSRTGKNICIAFERFLL